MTLPTVEIIYFPKMCAKHPHTPIRWIKKMSGEWSECHKCVQEQNEAMDIGWEPNNDLR